MKGPAGRLKHDVRRLWECPTCGWRERTGGDVVHRQCRCCNADPEHPSWMRLVEASAPRPPEPTQDA